MVRKLSNPLESDKDVDKGSCDGIVTKGNTAFYYPHTFFIIIPYSRSFIFYFIPMPVPRINSRTPLQLSTMSTITPLTAYLMATFQSRKAKHRTTFVALLALVCLSVYIFVAHASFLAPPLRHSDTPAADQLAIALETLQNSRLTPGNSGIPHSHRLSKSNRPNTPPLRLDPSQELAAISSFLASLPQNVLPPTVDPTRPVDPQLVLDFDTRSNRAQEEVQAMVEEVWTRNPVFLYSKVRTI